MEKWTSITLSTKGPFDLKRTLESGHSSFPIPVKDKEGKYYIVIKVPNAKKKTICRLYQKGKKLGVDLSHSTDLAL